MSAPEFQNGWNTWSNHVLKELERISKQNEELKKEFTDYRIQTERALTTLKVRVALIASGASMVIAGAMTAITNLIK